MSSNPLVPSFRFPAALPADSAHPQVRAAIENNTNQLVDVNQAIVALKTQFETLKAGTTTNTTNETIVGTTAGSTAGVSSFNGDSGAVTFFPDLFVVNNQTGVTSYVTQTEDNGALIVLNDASAIAVGLNYNVALNWACWVANYGSGTATLTPSNVPAGATSTISYPGNLGASSMPLGIGLAAFVFFDGKNFWGVLVPIGGGTGTVTAVTGVAPIVSSGGTTPAISLTTPVAVAYGGTGTATPGLVAGTGISITGSWPDQTVAATGLPVNNPTFTGKITGPLYVSNSAAPTVTPGSAAGAGASVTGIIGTNAGGSFTLTTGTGTTTGVLCTVTFANAYPTGAFGVVQGQNGASLASIFVGGIGAGSISISAISALTASSSYVITYIVSGY